MSRRSDDNPLKERIRDMVEEIKEL